MVKISSTFVAFLENTDFKERLNFSVYCQFVQNFVAFSENMNFDTVKIKLIYSEKTTKFEKIPKCCLALLDNFSKFCGLFGIYEQ